jgi:hypothetical protein
VNGDLVRQRLIAALESVPLVWAPYPNPIQHLFDAHTQEVADAVLAAGFVFQEASVVPAELSAEMESVVDTLLQLVEQNHLERFSLLWFQTARENEDQVDAIRQRLQEFDVDVYAITKVAISRWNMPKIQAS